MSGIDFTPSNLILDNVKNIEIKYNIDYENLICCYYRTTDKRLETEIIRINDFLNKINLVKNKYPGKKILFQSDCNEDELMIIRNNIQDVIIIQETNIHHRCFNEALNLLSIVLIMAKSNVFITTCSNVSSWVIFYNNIIKKKMDIYQYHKLSINNFCTCAIENSDLIGMGICNKNKDMGQIRLIEKELNYLNISLSEYKNKNSYWYDEL